MSKLKSLGRKLKLNSVNSAIMVHDKRRELAFNMIRERVATDKEFATDVLHAAGDTIPKDIKEIAEKTVMQDDILKNQEAIKSYVAEKRKQLDGFASIIDDGEPDGHGYVINHADELKALGCKTNEGCSPVDVPKEELLKTLEIASENQAKRLKAGGLL